MRLSLFVTLSHVLLLFLLSLHKGSIDKKNPTKIIVNIKEEKKSLKVEKQQLPKCQKIERAHYEEVAELAPLNFDPMPVIEPHVKHESIQPTTFPKSLKSEPKKTQEKIKMKDPVKKKAVKSKAKEESKPTLSTKPTLAKKSDEKLLKMMKDSLSKIDKMPKLLPSKTLALSSGNKVPKIAALQSEALTLTPMELSYGEELAILIKHHLHFPDEGTMKLKLLISNKGKVESFTIISSSSQKNKEIAQKAIASITFPPFGSRFANEKSKSFTLELIVE